MIIAPKNDNLTSSHCQEKSIFYRKYIKNMCQKNLIEKGFVTFGMMNKLTRSRNVTLQKTKSRTILASEIG